MATRISSQLGIVVWYYQADDASWIRFGDIENEILEDANKKCKKTVELDLGLIDFDRLVLLEKDSKNQRAIKRDILSSNETPLRQQRFYITPKLVKALDTSDSNDVRFINQWRKQNRRLSIEDQLEQAVSGVLEESRKLKVEIEGQWIANRIRSLKGKPMNDIEKEIILLYTRESFLYHIINQTLRDDDQSKIKTLGSFCNLLFHCDCSNNLRQFGYNERLYRGAQLDQATIDSYEKSIGTIKTWDAFSSTSKIRSKAECFGNVLFIIDLAKSARYRFSGMDVSSLSAYPQEEEVLIRAARNFLVDRVEKDPMTNKTVIYLSLC